MFLIEKSKNEAISLNQKTFTELDFKERQNLQEWIDKNPNILGEPLLIIQKEFSGFSDTNERLDLLALDKHSDLVIIENKLDDSGKDVTWQALKYVSYCAGLTKSEIKEIYSKYLNCKNGYDKSEEMISAFMDNTPFEELKLNSGDQRTILVSAMFRKEVTSTVMWLLEHGISIKCIKVTPYQYGEQIFLDTDQILPPPDTEDLRVKLYKKKQDEFKTDDSNAIRYNKRYRFWTKALPILQKKADMYLNVSPTKDNWIVGATGFGGLGYNCVVTQKGVRVELYIGKESSEDNIKIYNYLYSKKEDIENDFGSKLLWYELEGKAACRIVYKKSDSNVFNEDEWDKIIDFLANNIKKLKFTLENYSKQAIKAIS